MTTPDPTAPAVLPATALPQRRWGWALVSGFISLLATGFALGDLHYKKTRPAMALGAAALLTAVGAVLLFRSKRVPPPPEPKLTGREVGLALLTGLLSSTAFPMLFPPLGKEELLPSGITEPLLWVSLIPLLRVLEGATTRRAALLGLISGMGFFNVTIWWIYVALSTFGGLPAPLAVPILEGLCLWCALHWCLGTWSGQVLKQRYGLPVWLAFPTAWTFSELVRNHTWSGFPWTNLGYGTTRNLWFSQVAGIAGVYGIAWAITHVNAVAHETWAALVRKDRPLPRGAIASAAAILLGGHAYGAFRVARIDAALATAPSVKVALVQGNIDQRIKNRHDTYVPFILDQYIPETNAADDEGAELIVWPEASYPGYFRPGTVSIRRPQWRDSYKANLLLGVQTANFETRRSSNSAFWVRPDLSVAGQYDKHHLVPFGEYVLWDLDRWLPVGPLVQDVGLFTPGKELPIWEVPVGSAGRSVKLGMLICYDAIFPEITLDYAARDVELLVNITNDAWYGFASAPYQFLRMVQMRAIESGRSVVRAANTGVSLFYDPAGRISKQTQLGLVDSKEDRVDPSLHVPATHITDDVKLVQLPPPYVSLGNVFAEGCYWSTLFAVAFAMFRRKAAASA